MSKKSHSRPETAANQRARLEREAFEAKKSKIRRITAIVTVSVLAVLILIGAVGLIAWNVRLNRGDYLRAEIAASGGGAEVDGAMMNYYFNDIYNTFVEYYGSYVEYYGLDTTAPLRTQYIDTTESWFDYFMTGAKDTVTDCWRFTEQPMRRASPSLRRKLPRSVPAPMRRIPGFTDAAPMRTISSAHSRWRRWRTNSSSAPKRRSRPI